MKTPTSSSTATKKYHQHQHHPSIRALVQYDSFVSDDDESTPLKEWVDVSCMRPLPPPPPSSSSSSSSSSCFEININDVVDAYHLDGWWVGVVSHVSEDKSRFFVVFQNPAEVLEFGVSDLRFHFDWVDGKWVRPLSHQEIMGGGKQLEVTNNGLQSSEECITHGSSGATTTDAPLSPMILQTRKKKATAKSNVALSHSSKKQKKGVANASSIFTMAFPSAVIIPNKTVLSDSPASSTTQGNQVLVINLPLLRTFNPFMLDKIETVELMGGGTSSQIERIANLPKYPSKDRIERMENPANSPDKGKEDAEALSKKSSKDSKDAEVDRPVTVGLRAIVAHRQETTKASDSGSKNEESAVGIVALSGNTVSGNKSMRLTGISPQPNADCSKFQPPAVAHRQETTKASDSGSKNEESGVGIVALSSNPVSENNCTSTFDPWKPSGKEFDSIVQHSAISEISGTLPNMSQSLPFVKTLTFWRDFETWEVFQRLPQRPHFDPLTKVDEMFRESEAVANMVTFSNLVNKISNLQPDEPKRVYDGILNTIRKLETHGFDVRAIQSRLEQLRSIYNGLEGEQQQVKEFESAVLELTQKLTRAELNLETFRKHTEVMQTKANMALSEKIYTELQLNGFKIRLETSNENISIARCKFRSLAAAPW